jgi:hypothetical protein
MTALDVTRGLARARCRVNFGQNSAERNNLLRTQSKPMSPMHGINLLFAFALCAAFCDVAEAQAPPTALDATPKVYPGTQEHLWTFYVPVLTFERHEILVQTLAPTIRSRRLEYESPALRAERFKLGQLAEFHCKYADWWELPNECGMYWHDVYADLPQLAMQRNHIDYDAAEWEWRERRIRFDIPRCVWTERTLRVMVPVLSPEEAPPPEWSQAPGVRLARESVDRARGALVAIEGDIGKTVRDALAALDSGIAVAVAQGADPRRLATVEGATIDLAAVRSALLAEQARELGRLARIRAELAAAVSGSNEVPAASR